MVDAAARQPNVLLLRRTLARIEAHPEEWNQTKWISACGTVFCFAAMAAILVGAKVYRHADGAVSPDLVVPFFAHEPTLVQYYAAEILGLEEDWYVAPDGDGDSEWGIELFDVANTLDDLRCIVDELCGGAQ